MTNRTKMIPFECLVCDPSLNARKKEKSIDDLAESIKTYGLLHPLGVKAKSKPEADGTQHYFIIYGNRRYRAIKKIREEEAEAFSEIPVFVKNGTLQNLQEVNLVENLDREELCPGEVAEAIVKMVNSGMEQRTIAKRLGRPQSWVSYHYKVATKLSTEAWDAFNDGDLTFEQALHVADIPEDDQPDLVEKIKGAETSAAARKIAKEASNQAGTKRKYSNKGRPTAKNLVRYVQDVSFDGQSEKAKDKAAFYNGIAAGLRISLGALEIDNAKPNENYLDTSFTTTPGKSEEEEDKN